ncbi:hypothetical protein [Niallia taxi]|uniref:hypothetical protein n=1 Tax=Niallia taxi TaxID=2499688 RepID=UPI0012482ED0|nr:hypothetical protein [Niallia taxi]MCM3212942.1 hypothetical protein [Niallia taxi]MED4041266.1 hypothetical protein [Niallia taxi]
MRIIHLLLAIVIIVIGSVFSSITFNDELTNTIIIRTIGVIVLIGGAYYLKKKVVIRKMPALTLKDRDNEG